MRIFTKSAYKGAVPWSRTHRRARPFPPEDPRMTGPAADPDRDGRAHCGHTVAVPDQPDAKRYIHCHGSAGPSTAMFPARAAAMAACEQSGTP